MSTAPFPARDRRAFLRLTGLLASGTLLAGCGGGRSDGSAASDAGASAAMPGAATAAALPSTGGGPANSLNLALTLAYIGAQYYGHAARGVGIPATATAGVGEAGEATGARRLTFVDPALADHAAELADDKFGQVLALRAQLGGASAAQPAIDLSATSPTGAFATMAREIGIGSGFDPYASDASFLVGAYLVESRVAAAYRSLLDEAEDGPVTAVLTANLAQSIYHGGLISTLIDARAGTDALTDAAPAAITRLLASIEGTDTRDAERGSADVTDAGGRAIAFTRSSTQVLQAVSMSSRGTGGFLPMGANGIAA